jgi:predicted nucleic acid-binding protein
VAQLSGRVGGTLVLDAEGLVKLAKGDLVARSYFEDARQAKGGIFTAASTLTEVLRGGPRDAPVFRILRRMTVVPVDTERARAAGELLGRTGLDGHRCALDALVATVALDQARRPVVLLTSDTKDMDRLTEEPERPRKERIAVIRI